MLKKQTSSSLSQKDRNLREKSYAVCAKSCCHQARGEDCDRASAQPHSISPGQTHEAPAGTEGTGVPSSRRGRDVTAQLHPSPAPRPWSRARASPGVDVTSRRSSTPYQPRARGLLLGPPAGTQESTSRHCWAAVKVKGDAREAPVSDLHK